MGVSGGERYRMRRGWAIVGGVGGDMVGDEDEGRFESYIVIVTIVILRLEASAVAGCKQLFHGYLLWSILDMLFLPTLHP